MNNNNFELREWQLSDVASLAENANNIHIWNNLRDALPHPYSEKDAKEYIEMALSKPKPTTMFAIVVDGKAVGSIGFFPRTDVERISAELGYFIGEGYWDKGIMTEAVKRIVTYAFTTFPLQKIYATPFDFNIASQKVLQKAGFEREAILKQAAIKNGKIVDLHYYSMFKSRWLESVVIRPLDKEDLPILKDLLYEAIFIPEGVELPPRDIIEKPEVEVYIRDFGAKKDDLCLLATIYGKIVGGVWVRTLADEIKGFGNIDPETPEFAISVFKEYRNMGIGTALMQHMLDFMTHKGYKQTSLSVDKANYAVKMYKKLGFEIIRENEHDYIMVCKLNQ